MHRLCTVLWLAASTCAAAPAARDVPQPTVALGDPVRITIHSPADFAAATGAMSTLAWGDPNPDARLDVSIAAGDYGGQSLQLKQDATAKNRVVLVVHGEGRAAVSALALDLEASQVTVADLVFTSGSPLYTLKVRTPGKASLDRLAFVDQVVGLRSGPASGAVLLLEASSASATATATDCAFVGGAAQGPVPMIALRAQPASMFEQVDLVRTTIADAAFPVVIATASAKQLTLSHALIVLRPESLLVRADAPWAQLALDDVTLLADSAAQVMLRSGSTPATYRASGLRLGTRDHAPAAPDTTPLHVDDAALTAAIAGLRSSVVAGPVDRAALERAAGLR